MKIYDRSKHSNNTTSNVTKITSAKAKDIAQSTSKNLRNNRNNTQDSYTSAKDTVQSTYTEMQKSIKQGWDQTRAWLLVGAAIAATFAKKNINKAQEKLENTQENLYKMQGPLQSNVRSRLAKTSDVIGKSTSKAKYGIQKATTRVKELQDTWQEQSAQRQRKSKRAKTLFRWGLIFGMTLALLYSPIAGSEVRQRISKGWQQSSDFLRRMCDSQSKPE
jgi:HAMP domain-containing protein